MTPLIWRRFTWLEKRGNEKDFHYCRRSVGRFDCVSIGGIHEKNRTWPSSGGPRRVTSPKSQRSIFGQHRRPTCVGVCHFDQDPSLLSQTFKKYNHTRT